MNALKEYADMPRVEINGRIYVDKEIFIRLLDKNILEEKRYCESDDERSAFDVCRNIVLNMLTEQPNDSSGAWDKAINDFIDEILNAK